MGGAAVEDDVARPVETAHSDAERLGDLIQLGPGTGEEADHPLGSGLIAVAGRPGQNESLGPGGYESVSDQAGGFLFVVEAATAR